MFDTLVPDIKCMYLKYGSPLRMKSLKCANKKLTTLKPYNIIIFQTIFKNILICII